MITALIVFGVCSVLIMAGLLGLVALDDHLDYNRKVQPTPTPQATFHSFITPGLEALQTTIERDYDRAFNAKANQEQLTPTHNSSTPTWISGDVSSFTRGTDT